MNKNVVNLIDKELGYLRISQKITPQKTADMGCCHLISGTFIDPETQENITFEDSFYTSGVFNPDRSLVRDITKKDQVYVSLH